MFFLSPVFTRESWRSRHLAVESVELVTTLYFIATLAVGLFFLTHPFLVTFQYSIESIVTGIYLIFLLVTIVLNNNIAKNEIASDAVRMFLKNLYVKAEFLKSKQTDTQIIEQIEKLQEDSCYSQTKSSPNVKEMENQILTSLDELTKGIENLNKEKLISEVTKCSNLLKQRNLILRKI
jgi:hypothetical protein